MRFNQIGQYKYIILCIRIDVIIKFKISNMTLNLTTSHLASTVLNTAMPVIYHANLENGVSMDIETQNFVDEFYQSLPRKARIELGLLEEFDKFSNDFNKIETLPSVNQYSYFDQEGYFDAWTPENLQRCIPDSYNEQMTDQFDDSDLPDLDDGPERPIAEMQEDVAPSDPVSINNLNVGIMVDRSEEDKNLSGGIVQSSHIGAEDANPEGPASESIGNDYQIIEKTGGEISESNIPQPPSVQSQSAPDIGDYEKEDIKGDIGLDSAEQSSYMSSLGSLNIDFENKISPYLPLPQSQAQKSNGGTNGVVSNLNRGELETAIAKFETFKNYVSSQTPLVEECYTKLNNTVSEIMSIDNIVNAQHLMLTPSEKVTKADNRIQRLAGVQKLLEDQLRALKDADGFFISAIVSLSVVCTSMIAALNKWKKNPDNNAPLREISTFISPSSSFIVTEIEKAKARYDHATNHSVDSYSRIIQDYQDSDSSERDISKVLKFDYDFSPAHNKFTKRMKKLYNKEINDCLKMQRMTRSKLKALTFLSNYNTDKYTNAQNIKNRTKQEINTASINTDNIEQKYSTIPRGAKTNSRRLNLLETPVAMRNTKSIPYVNMYDQSKILFS